MAHSLSMADEILLQGHFVALPRVVQGQPYETSPPETFLAIWQQVLPRCQARITLRFGPTSLPRRGPGAIDCSFTSGITVGMISSVRYALRPPKPRTPGRPKKGFWTGLPHAQTIPLDLATKGKTSSHWTCGGPSRPAIRADPPGRLLDRTGGRCIGRLSSNSRIVLWPDFFNLLRIRFWAYRWSRPWSTIADAKTDTSPPGLGTETGLRPNSWKPLLDAVVCHEVPTASWPNWNDCAVGVFRGWSRGEAIGRTNGRAHHPPSDNRNAHRDGPSTVPRNPGPRNKSWADASRCRACLRKNNG